MLGVTGGIAAYKAVLLARRLIEAGHDVHVVPTEDALKFVGKPTWEAISRNPVTTSVHEDVPEVRHVGLGQRADLIIIAPATANTIAKMTAGIADDLLGTTLLASKAPVLIAPAMHTEMWEHPSTQHNMRVLRERGVYVIGPDSGRLTGSDTGPGRMSEPDAIFDEAERLLQSGDLSGTRVLVTAGGTREPIDPVRYIGNRSSGRQGLAVAEAAAARGASVTLVAANIEDALLEALPRSITVERVGSTAELQEATVRHAADHDAVFMVAAVSDYRVAEVSDGKVRKESQDSDELTISLVENPDILKGLVETHRPGQTIIGFAAETGASVDEVLDYGRRKLARKGCDWLAVNEVGWKAGFESLDNTLHMLSADGGDPVTVSGTKLEVAAALVNTVLSKQ